jgi:hypothetical protein
MRLTDAFFTQVPPVASGRQPPVPSGRKRPGTGAHLSPLRKTVSKSTKFKAVTGALPPGDDGFCASGLETNPG